MKKKKKNVFNTSRSFLDLKKSTLGFCRPLKGRSLKNRKHTELTHFPLAKR